VGNPKDYLESTFQSFSLTIVDLLGVFIPGIIWVIVLHNGYNILCKVMSIDIKDFGFYVFVKELLKNYPNSSTLNLSILIFLSFSIGYFISTIAMHIGSEIAPVLYYRIIVGKKCRYKVESSDNKYLWKRYRYIKFPFNKIFNNENYFEQIKNIVSSHEIDIDGQNKAYNRMPFTLIKRKLKVNCPSLWAGMERAEAMVRMLGSIFLALTFNFIMIFIASWFILDFSNYAIFHIIISLGLMLISSYAFIKRQENEVANCYLNYLIYLKQDK